MSPQRRTRWRDALRSAFAERLALKAAAIFFALVLWMVVSAEEPTDEVVPIRFAPVVDSGVVIVGPLPTVRALVLGRGRELLKLYTAAPVIVRHIQGNGAETVSLELGPADVDLPAGVNAVVRDVRPRHVTLRLRRVEQEVGPAGSAVGGGTPAGDTPRPRDSANAMSRPRPGEGPTDTVRQRQ
ncbi:MAG TPA: hypothetical protein VG432_00115 [Gemmatimonadaceae bacterium]|nr:hypothetical protein [Gemmatimonadaceae bacterium]